MAAREQRVAPATEGAAQLISRCGSTDWDSSKLQPKHNTVGGFRGFLFQNLKGCLVAPPPAAAMPTGILLIRALFRTGQVDKPVI